MNNDNISISFLEFAWESLTEQQQYRINVKYELKLSLENRDGESKRTIYRAISNKFGYEMKTIEKIANSDLKEFINI